MASKKEDEEKKEINYAAHQQRHQDKNQTKVETQTKEVSYDSLSPVQKILYDHELYKQKHAAFESAQKTAEEDFDSLVSAKSKTDELLYGDDERSRLTDYYKKWQDTESQAINNNNLEGYYKSVIMQNKIGNEISRNSNALDFLGDFRKNAETTLLSAIHNIEDASTQAYVDATNPDPLQSRFLQDYIKGKTGIATDVGIQHSIESLENLHKLYPQDEKITKLYNGIANKNLQENEIAELADYANSLYKTDTYNKLRNPESALEEQRYQDEKLKEMLSWNDLGQGVLNTESVVLNMAPSIAAAAVSGGAGATAGIQSLASILTLGAGVKGQTTNEKLNEGYDWGRANLYGAGAAAVEMGTELLGGEAVNSLIFGHVASTPIGKATASLVKRAGVENKLSKALIALGSNIGSEMTEEAISAAIDPILGKVILNEDIDPGDYVEGIFKSAIEAIPSTFIMAGAGQAQIINSVNATEKVMINSITNNKNLTNAQKAEMIKKVQEVSQDAKLGISSNFTEIVNEVQGQMQMAQTKNQAINKLASFLEQDTTLTPEQKQQRLQEFASKFNQTYNTDKLTTQELLDTSKRSNVTYNNTNTINNEIEAMRKDDPNVTKATPVTEINQVQQNIKSIIEKLTNKQVVYVDMQANGEKVYGFTNPASNSNNIYINSNLNTTDSLAASYHEIGHHYKLQNSALYQSFLKENNLKDSYDAEESFGNYIAQTMTKGENIKSVEKSTRTLFQNLAELGNKVANKALGTELKNTKVSAYNLNNPNYLSNKEFVSSNALEQQVLNTFKNSSKEKAEVKPVEKKVDKPKKAEYNTPKKETTKGDTLQERYNQKIANNESELSIRRMIGLSIGAKPNSAEVDAKLNELKNNGTKFSKKGDSNEKEKGNIIQRSKASISHSLFEIFREYKGRLSSELTKKEVKPTDESQIEIQRRFQSDRNTRIKYFYEPTSVYNAFTDKDGTIWINNRITNRGALSFLAEHEYAETLFLSGNKDIFDLLKKHIYVLLANDTIMEQYLNDEIPVQNQQRYKSQNGKVELAKELIFDINGSRKFKEDYPAQQWLKELIGEDKYNSISADLNQIEQKINGNANNTNIKYSKENSNESSFSMPKNETKFSKESSKDTAINNLRNELAKDEDKIKATEMWAKRTGRTPLVKKIETRDRKIMKLVNDKQNAKTLNKIKNVFKRVEKKKAELRTDLRNTIKRFKNSEAFKFLSPEQQELFKDTFGSYYLKANGKTELTKMKDNVRGMVAEMLNEDPDVVISKHVKEMLDAPKQKTFNEVETLEELQDLTDALEDIIMQAKGEKKLVGLEQAKSAMAEKKAFTDDVEARYQEAITKQNRRDQKRAKRSTSPFGRVVNAIGSKTKAVKDITRKYINQLSTLKAQLTFMAGGNKASRMLDLHRNLFQGVSREREAYVGLNRSIDKFMEDKQYKELRKGLSQKAEFKDTGKDVVDTSGTEHRLRLNSGERISLAMHSLQEQSKAHIAGKITDVLVDQDGRAKTVKKQGGGLTIPNEELLRAGKFGEAVKMGYTIKLTSEEIDDILGKQVDEDGNVTFTNLTEQENEFVKALTNSFFKRTAEYTNKVSKARKGYDIAGIENYFPLMSNRAYIYDRFDNQNIKTDLIAESLGLFDNMGFTKERSDNAFNPIVLEPIQDVVTRMIRGVSKYYGYDIALYNNKVLLESRTENGISVEDMLDKIDNTFLNNYGTLTGYLSGRLSQPHDLFSKFRGKHAEFTLGLNPGVWVKQLLSIPTTMKYFKTKDMLGYLLGGELRLHNTMKNFVEQYGEAKKGHILHEFTSFLTNDLEYRKMLGFGNPDAADLKDNKSAFERLDILNGISRFDMLGVDTVTRMLLFSELNSRGLLGDRLTNLNEDELNSVLDEIGTKLETLLRETQPDYAEVNRANISRNTGSVSRLLTMYSTALLQMFNNFSTSVAEANYARKSGDATLIKQNGSQLVKSALGLVIASTANVAISRMFSKLFKQGGDDDDDFDFTKETIVALLSPTLILDDVARGVLKLQQYDSQTPELAAYDAIINLAGDIGEIVSSGEEEKKFKQIENVIKNVGLATGIPTRDLMKIAKTTLFLTDSDLYYQVALRENQNAYKKWLEDNTSQDVRNFYNAYLETRDAKLISKYGWEKGKKDSKKQAYKRALEEVFGNDQQKVDEYMVILGGYKNK